MHAAITCQFYLRRLWCIDPEVIPMSQKSPAIFVADSTALDFLNSIATPADIQIDWISDGEDLLAWLEQAHLVPADVLAAIRTRAKPGEIDGVAAQARNLREWFRKFVYEHKGKALKAADLADLGPLNRLLGSDEMFGQLVAHKHGKTTAFEFQIARRWETPESLLLPIAEALARLLAEEVLPNVKACEGATCTLIFADRTRARSRRWCSMSICGNRAKQIAHRQRLKQSR
jgi:predicted RNA-binding Zn ribbon-like protein